MNPKTKILIDSAPSLQPEVYWESNKQIITQLKENN
jgi:hypothetical protein